MQRVAQSCRTIIGVGRNYADHAKELGNAVPAGSPILFLKPAASMVFAPNAIRLPRASPVVHHEVELAVVMGRRTRRVAQRDAMAHVQGYTLALDMTARTLQDDAKRRGLPWTVAKGYDTFTPLADTLLPASTVADPHRLRLWCTVNDLLRQKGDTKDMLFKIPALIEFISHIMTLDEGDMILTGTPAGVGPLLPGDKIECGLETQDGRRLVGMKFRAETDEA